MFKCCGISISNSFMFHNHFFYHHFDQRTSSTSFVCRVKNCKRKIRHLQNLKQHFQDRHLVEFEKVFGRIRQPLADSTNRQQGSALSQQPTVNHQIQLPVYDDCAEDLFEPDDLCGDHPFDEEEAEEKILKKLCEIKQTITISESALCFTINQFAQLLSQFMPNSRLLELSTDLTNSTYWYNRYLEKNFNYKTEERQVTIDGRVHKYYYTDLRDQLTKFLGDQSIRDELVKQKQHTSTDNVYSSYKDAKVFQKSILSHPEEDDVIRLDISIFFDDFNPLDSQSPSGSDHKQSAVYYVINNLPYECQSRRDQIFTMAIAKRLVVDHITLEEFFDKIIRDIEQLNEDPIVIDGIKFKVHVLCVVSDNLGANQLARISTCFRSKSCKYCKVSYKQLQKLKNLTKRWPRRFHFGSVFRRLRRKYLLVPDLFHDFNEGIILKVLGPILKKFYSNDFSALFRRMAQIEWPNGRIKSISKEGKLKGNGCQIFDFFLLFPFICPEVKRTKEHLVYLQLRKLVNFFTAHAFTKADLQHIKFEIEYFYEIYFKFIIKPSLASRSNKKHVKVTMKMHHLVHYVKLIKLFGPLYVFSTLRFERKHQSCKKSIKSSNCRKNLSYSIIKNLNFNLRTSDQTIERVILRDRISSVFEDRRILEFLDVNSELVELSHLVYNKIKFTKGHFYILKRTSENLLPIFVQILHILKQENAYIVIGLQFETIEFDNKRYSYVLRETNDLVRITSLEHYKSCLKVRKFIVKDFYLGIEYCDDYFDIPY